MIWRPPDKMIQAAHVQNLGEKTRYVETPDAPFHYFISLFHHSIIFSPSMISSGRHYNKIARFRVNCRSNALALWAIAIILLTQWRGSHRYDNTLPTGSFQKECFLIPHCTWPFPKISFSEWSRNRKIRTAHYRRLATHSSAVSWNTSDRLLCSGYSSEKIIFTFVVFARHKCSTRATTTLTLTYGSFLRCTSLVIIETLLTSKVPVAFIAGYANIFKCASRAHHSVITRLVAYVRHVSPKLLLHALQTFRLPIAPVRFVITW